MRRFSRDAIPCETISCSVLGSVPGFFIHHFNGRILRVYSEILFHQVGLAYKEHPVAPSLKGDFVACLQRRLEPVQADGGSAQQAAAREGRVQGATQLGHGERQHHSGDERDARGRHQNGQHRSVEESRFLLSSSSPLWSSDFVHRVLVPVTCPSVGVFKPFDLNTSEFGLHRMQLVTRSRGRCVGQHEADPGHGVAVDPSLPDRLADEGAAEAPHARLDQRCAPSAYLRLKLLHGLERRPRSPVCTRAFFCDLGLVQNVNTVTQRRQIRLEL